MSARRARSLYEQTQRLEALNALVEAATKFGEVKLLTRMMAEARREDPAKFAWEALCNARSDLRLRQERLALARARVKTFFAKR